MFKRWQWQKFIYLYILGCALGYQQAQWIIAKHVLLLLVSCKSSCNKEMHQPNHCEALRSITQH